MVYEYSSNEEKLIIALLNRNNVSALDIAENTTLNTRKLVSMADRHMVFPLILDRLFHLPLQNIPADELFPKGRRIIIAAAAVNMKLRSELSRTTRILGKEGISFLLIKGFAVDKNPLRKTNDIDILIHREDLHRTVALLEKAGYNYTGSGVMSAKEIQNPFGTLDWNNQFQFETPSGGVSLEVHTNLFERDRIRLEKLDKFLDNVDLFWKESRFDEELGCSIPSTEATLALLCVHSSTKRSPAHNTYIARHAYDILQTLKCGVDQSRFISLCTSWGLEYYAYTALYLTSLCLNTDAPLNAAAPLEDLLSKRCKRLADIHLKCFRGLGHASFFYRMLFALLMPMAIGGNLRKILRHYRLIVFPPLWQQENLFGVRRDSAAIYLTYLYGPFVRAFVIMKRWLSDG
ncbi:hypothetical protein B4O97_15970 [Marispirochaeta aestuarii]|uniref:Nucleotidyltransferase n=1 Tax=Marispirochaeta aestuarii TaxID=1963862 RepID=A0A1Y1RUI9_9SPIO|nr:nucleotidyltransferase family protein [Marispirochaeta aestuarii]ORC32655.1 hypothetical protein B4O97_15970 [Marispirochaeta aestuarii]